MSQNYQGPPPGSHPQHLGGNPPQSPQQGVAPQAGMPQGGVAAPVKRKSKKTAIIASALVLALLVGGGVLAWSLLRGAAPAAAKGVPSNALAVLEVSLNPSVGDKLAVKDLAEKFPYVKDQAGDAGDDYKKALWSVLAKTSDFPDYESEVKPWLGDSVAVAVLPGKDSSSRSGPSTYVVSVQVTDKDAAKAFADKHIKDSAAKTIFVDDLMVITNDEDGNVSETSLKDSNITSVDSYKADMGKLGDGYLATAWVSSDLIKQATASSGADTTGFVESRYALGLKVQDGALALRGITWQKDEIKDRGESVKDIAGSMPGDWLGSLTFSLPSNLVDNVWEHLTSSSTRRQLSDIGLSSADDLRSLLGTQFAFAVTGDTESPQIGIKVRTNDPEKHKNIVEKFANSSSLKNVNTTVEGDTVITTVGTSADSFSNPSDKLSGNGVYEKLTGGIDNPQFSGWVNVPQVIKVVEQQSGSRGLPAQLKENLEPISGVGMVAGQIDDHYFDSWVRVGTK